jgi:DNA primase
MLSELGRRPRTCTDLDDSFLLQGPPAPAPCLLRHSKTRFASQSRISFPGPLCSLPPGWLLADDRDALKQQVRAASDIVDVVGGYVSLRPAGPTYKGLCPFHDDHRPSFDVDPRRQRYRCWSCGKFGDVFEFVQMMERVSFPEALELLARRAGIALEKGNRLKHGPSRALMLDLVRWAAEQFHQCLLDSPVAEAARLYLGERQLNGDTVRRFALGFAPPEGNWLLQKAQAAGHSLEVLEKVGLIARRTEGDGWYDRFRDRVMFPIRDLRGQTVAFGGRILPSSPSADRAPKYYNSSETVLFSKSDHLYGIDQARTAAQKAGYLVAVEGYMDVLMAHQMGIENVVAPMGTALTGRQVQKLRGVVDRVVLVFDADEGGERGVDRALEVFVSHEMELKIATLPDGLDPCDLLVQKGAEAFQSALTKAVDVLEFKLNRVWAAEASRGIEGQRRAVDALLGVLALTPSPDSIKQSLMINRIAHRINLKEEIVWTRLKELRAARRDPDRAARPTGQEENGTTERKAPAAPHETGLLEVLLADPGLVRQASAEVSTQQVEHPGLRLLLEGLYRLQAEGASATLDQLRGRIDNPALVATAFELQERGLAIPDRAKFLKDILAYFGRRRAAQDNQDLRNQLHATSDHAKALELLRQRQSQTGT